MRKFHLVYQMVSWTTNDSILFTKEDFNEIIKTYLSDLDVEDRFNFQSCIYMNMGLENDYKKVENILHNLMLKAKYSFIKNYYFEEDKARKYILDFLESYKWNYKHLTYDQIGIDDQEDTIININIYAKQNLVKKLIQNYGSIRDQINIRKSNIKKIQGNSFKFILELSNNTIVFDNMGLSQNVS